MKRMLFPVSGFLFIFIIACESKSQNPPPKTSLIITSTGLDSLQLGMSKAELEKLLQTKIKLDHINVDGGPYDTFTTKYKGVEVTLFLDEGDNQTIAELYGLQTSDPSCKTTSGIGAGTEKAKVIDTYTLHRKFIAPEYETYPVRSKTKSAVAVMDTMDNKALVFHILNRKVSSMEVCSYYEFY